MFQPKHTALIIEASYVRNALLKNIKIMIKNATHLTKGAYKISSTKI